MRGKECGNSSAENRTGVNAVQLTMFHWEPEGRYHHRRYTATMAIAIDVIQRLYGEVLIVIAVPKFLFHVVWAAELLDWKWSWGAFIVFEQLLLCPPKALCRTNVPAPMSCCIHAWFRAEQNNDINKGFLVGFLVDTHAGCLQEFMNTLIRSIHKCLVCVKHIHARTEYFSFLFGENQTKTLDLLWIEVKSTL